MAENWKKPFWKFLTPPPPPLRLQIEKMKNVPNYPKWQENWTEMILEFLPFFLLSRDPKYLAKLFPNYPQMVRKLDENEFGIFTFLPPQ